MLPSYSHPGLSAYLAEVVRSDIDLFCTRALGSLSPTHKVDVEYPLAFQEAFIKRRSQQEQPADFRYVHVSGKLVEQDPDRKLFFLDAQRKTKVWLQNLLSSDNSVSFGS